jgi:hypothetical protein
MRKMFLMASVVAMCALMAGNALAVIGWAGNVWPLHNANVVPTGPVSVYAQVYKDGVTPGDGQGAGIEAFLHYTTDIAAEVIAPMSYNGEVGNNDEYTADVPQVALIGASYVDVHVKFHDTTDDTWWDATNDQSGNPPPQRYNVVDVLPVDVVVTFTLCMSGVATTGVPCVIGSAPEIGTWVTGLNMAPEGSHPDLYTVDVNFLAGGNPSFEYKFKKDGCATWEGTGNRFVTLPTDGTTSVVLAVDSWEFLPLGCDLGETLVEDKVVCIQVCMMDVAAPPVCVTGATDYLTNWGNGVPMFHLGGDLYQACIIFPAGLPIQTVEYKFRKDGCETWESVANRSVTLDNSSPPEQTLTHSWDDGPSVCEPVSIEGASWGTIKAQYR